MTLNLRFSWERKEEGKRKERKKNDTKSNKNWLPKVSLLTHRCPWHDFWILSSFSYLASLPFLLPPPLSPFLLYLSSFLFIFAPILSFCVSFFIPKFEYIFFYGIRRMKIMTMMNLSTFGSSLCQWYQREREKK